MPIRMRLTLWSTLIFGILLIGITSSIFFMHHASYYRDQDRLLTSVSLHIREELEKGLVEGTPLTEANFSFEEFSLNGVYVIVRDRTGKNIAKSANPYRAPDTPFTDFNKTQDRLLTYTDQENNRFRVMVTPIRYRQNIVGYIQAEVSLQQVDASLVRLGWSIFGVTFTGLLLAAIASWFMARKSLSGVEIISQTAQAITESQSFNQRVVYSGAKDELGHLAETFNEMLDSLEKAFVGQRRFISYASHELRAPLTAIRGNLDILQKNANIPSEEKADILSDVSREAKRMSKLVGDLLSLARADAGHEIQKGIVDVSNILKELESRILSSNPKVEITFKYQPSVMTWGNEDLLKQLILILLENAIRYTPESGQITLSIFQDSDYCGVEIDDTGIGIEPDDIPHIFDRFYRSKPARMYTSEGTGLGLALAKSIVDIHDGSIKVTSSPGQGSLFKVCLPKIIT
ncbi:ATP-binding protein [Paenibacillus timonensis]|uniref:histidine kinase n=1 Tax=Paenibacillus timonensis TaxID=225915 RepID=A0ABW3S899_9BACL|nr:sensor histidine kinase [Paenibacillus timonensis]MCH1638832.1 ATP-binding protein [Paenibacillus timonensis]